VSAGPLTGVRIVAVEQFGAGPLATLFLADLGADVIKIEHREVGGDVGRYIPPGQDGTSSLYFETFNRGKRSLDIDLKSERGREVFLALVATSDAVFSNLRGDQAEHLGLGYRDLEETNPAIVCVALSGYGSGQPDRPGYDALVQAEAGWASLTGDPDGPPVRSGLSLVDYVGGLVSAVGLLGGLVEARTTGRGSDVLVNLYDSALSMLAYQATWWLTLGKTTPRRPSSAHPSIYPFQFFRTADGFIAVACAKERFFGEMLTLMELERLLDDPRFASFQQRDRHRAELAAILEPLFHSAPTSYWIERFGSRVPVAPVRAMTEALSIDELALRGLLAEYDHPVFGTVRSVGSPIKVSGYTPNPRPAPSLGGDRREILESLGYDIDEIEDLERDGAFGSPGSGSPSDSG
jgi:crotonobetainyl-CoA:carnitine CoA-transferase CaiB-like acyl-CoA transferase